jgi:hypothetical protein
LASICDTEEIGPQVQVPSRPDQHACPAHTLHWALALPFPAKVVVIALPKELSTVSGATAGAAHIQPDHRSMPMRLPRTDAA